MRIAVFGASGQIGRGVCELLTSEGHDVVRASRDTRLPDSGYMRAKVAQETLIESSGLPYTIVRATQFIEFADAIVASLTEADVVRVPQARIQPIAAAEVVAHVARAAVGSPAGVVEIGGPETITFAELARIVLARNGDHRAIVVDPDATYFGGHVDDQSLVTGPGAVLGTTALGR
ncbi:SDR family oxidoreductase [Mycobacterium sp. DL592]|uniref:SDR family oxidoreductase n=1 Tax=Mycobacterium sp. DL592 TaxID=2675524 RepID=UPI00141FB796|nr:SDR family oxidoreductase [Mycobacterium sp. DL592]